MILMQGDVKMRKEPLWVRNEMDDGDKPVCPYCIVPYGDGDIFDIKNYPDSGMAAIFFMCEECQKEAELVIEWIKVKENKYEKI